MLNKRLLVYLLLVLRQEERLVRSAFFAIGAFAVTPSEKSYHIGSPLRASGP